MYVLNEKIRKLTPYEPLQGDYPVRLDANESFLPLPAAVLASLANAARMLAYNRYPDPLATAPVQAFAAAYDVDAELVTAGNGSDELISVLCGAFLTRGDAMMVLEPDFSMYSFYGSLAEAKVLRYEKRDDLTIDIDRVVQLANVNDVRLLIFSNPCNPTSLGLKREDVRRLLHSVRALVVLDEAYMDFWDQSLLREAERYDNLIILRTCSKAVGTAALRLGFAVANATLTRALRAVKSPYNVNAFSQAAGAAVLQESTALQAALGEIIASRDRLFSALRGLEAAKPERLHVYEGHTNFLLIKLQNAEKIYHALLEHGIAVRFFEGYLRVTAGLPMENAEFIAIFKKLL